MTEPMAFRATYADWKLIKTRGVVQVVFEVPLADSDAAYDVLGGMPNSANESWFAIAPLKSPPAEKENETPTKESPATPRRLDKPAGAKPEKRDWRTLPPAQQAGIRCDDPIFAAYLKEQRPDDWHECSDPVDCVYLICGITSRAELGTDQKARVIWHQLDMAFQAWKALEHA